MPQLFITRTVGKTLTEGRVVTLPRKTIDRISEETGSSDWHRETARGFTREQLLAQAETRQAARRPARRSPKRKVATAP